MTLELVAVDGLKWSGEAYRVTLPTDKGEIAVYGDTAHIVSVLSPGLVRIKLSKESKDDDELFAVGGGVVEATGKRVRVLVDSADSNEEVSKQKAEEALQRAFAQAANAEKTDDIEAAAREIALQQSRLQLANLKNRRTRR